MRLVYWTMGLSLSAAGAPLADARAFSCERFLAEDRAETAFARAPEMTLYKTPDGRQRSHRNGIIHEYRDRRWVEIGEGYVGVDGRVYETSLLPRGVRLQREQEEASNRSAQARSILELTPLAELPVEITRTGEFPLALDGSAEQVRYAVYRMEARLRAEAKRLSLLVPLEVESSLARGFLDTLRGLPFERLETIGNVRVMPRAQTVMAADGGPAAADASPTGIRVYPCVWSFFQTAHPEALRISRHEFGHMIAYSIFGRATPDEAYADGARRDGNQITEYGRVGGLVEDFAEAVELYLRTNAGRLSPGTRLAFARRFAFLDDVFSYRTPQSEAPIQSRPASVGRAPRPIWISMARDGTVLAISFQDRIGLLLPPP